jgi:hypothetical protein
MGKREKGKGKRQKGKGTGRKARETTTKRFNPFPFHLSSFALPGKARGKGSEVRLSPASGL